MATISPTKISKAKLSKQVAAYCAQHGLRSDLDNAIHLAFLIYHPVANMAARVQADPDAEEERMVLDVPVAGELNEVLQRNMAFTKQWVELASSNVRERIRVLYHFA